MGREFIELFNHWADTYDETVSGQDPEYKEVFSQYEDILNEVSSRVSGFVIEFGVGTGNLTQKLVAKQGVSVMGVEPSDSMRSQAAKKLPAVPILEGDFISFPVEQPIDAFVSSYAFHHLTDVEKETAIEQYSRLLPKGGKVVFADTIFASDEAKKHAIQRAKDQHFLSLSQDLATEYYTTIEVMRSIFNEHGFTVHFKQMNPYVCIMDATKM